jgi:hypothetical protein
VRTKRKQLHTKILVLVVKILDSHPSARHNTSRFGRVCDPLTRFPLRKRIRLIRQSLGFQKKRSSFFARFPTNPLFRKPNQVSGGYNMTRTKIIVFMTLVLALVAIGHHQLRQLSKQALNTNFVPAAYAQSTPTPTPTPTPSPTPTPAISEACTPGFFKNHPQFITGGTCFPGITQNSTVAALFGTASGINSCVSSLTLLQALSDPPNQCGGGLPQAELILIKQAITRVLNATNSSPPACTAAMAVITTTNSAIATAVATNDISGLTSLADSFDKLDNDQPCNIGGFD